MADSEVGRRHRDAEPHGVAIGDQDVTGAAGLSTDGNDREATSEERVGRIRYFDFIRRYESRVLERGINLLSRWVTCRGHGSAGS